MVTNLARYFVALESDPGSRTSEMEFCGVRVSTIHFIGTGVTNFLPWAMSFHLYEMYPPHSLHSPIKDNLVSGSILSLQFDLQLEQENLSIKDYFHFVFLTNVQRLFFFFKVVLCNQLMNWESAAGNFVWLSTF